jgi:hypothetical protein
MTETSGGSSYSSRNDDSQGETNGGASGRGAQGKEWLGQLQSMIDNLATQAGPVLRDVAAKAAELAAAAGDKAGPIAHKAAEVTESAGHKLAERGREVAAELRREGQGQGGGAAEGDTPNAIDATPTGTTTYPTTATGGTASTTTTTSPETPTSRADSLGE